MPPARVAARSIALLARPIARTALIGTFLIGSASTVSAQQYDDGAMDEAVEGVDVVASGQYIVDFAWAYYGSPYVAGGNGPGGFDCSGFTQFVILNTVGIDIGHAVENQPWSGAWVDWGNWQPGDLVFFANTYRAGISHAGIYVGDGQFIHAENEGTGVTVSSIYSDYYGSRYYGATRLW
jgi:cell wall-associated NlpC family hydrolase